MTALLGRYELLRPLGRGGMAEVFLARYVGPEGFEKRLVIKKLLPQLADDRHLLRMFFEEAKTHVGLSHSNLVSVFDFGRVGNDYFIAMEHVDGADLGALFAAERLHGRGLAPAVAAYLGIEICRGLSYVHRKGFVHRDISPRNVLLTSDGEAKLSDFGLVLSQASDVSGIRGTLAYIAPEQARGERVDGRADLYSLGVVLAEAVTGRRLREAADQVSALALAQAPEPLTIEGPLGEIVARATQAAPEARYADADEMLGALERVASRMEGGREASLRALAAKVRSVAPSLDGVAPGPALVAADPGILATAPGSTANYRGVGPAPRETYFRDQRSQSFVEDVLDAAPPPAEGPQATPSSRWRRGPLVAAALLGALALLWWRAPRGPAPVAPPATHPDTDPSLSRPVPPAQPPPSPAQPPPSPAQPPPSPLARDRAASARATLILRCTPWCVPYVDGKPRGSDGRRHQLSLSPGAHQVRAHRLEDHLERSIKLRAGETQTLELEFP